LLTVLGVCFVSLTYAQHTRIPLIDSATLVDASDDHGLAAYVNHADVTSLRLRLVQYYSK